MKEVEMDLKIFNEDLNQLQKLLSPKILEPFNLELDSLLKKTSEITNLYKKILNELKPSHKNYVLFPNKSDSTESETLINENFQIKNIDNLLNDLIDIKYNDPIKTIEIHNKICSIVTNNFKNYLNSYNFNNIQKKNKNFNNNYFKILKFIYKK